MHKNTLLWEQMVVPAWGYNITQFNNTRSHCQFLLIVSDTALSQGQAIQNKSTCIPLTAAFMCNWLNSQDNKQTQFSNMNASYALPQPCLKALL